jgi:CDP-diacylglycerol--serine O-phosphatidyltransferase
MRTSKYRYLIPNGITFLSLTCGILSILAAITGNIWWAGSLILCSYILDLFDGATARTLNAGTDFGLQLDSLVDMVSLGTAPTVLIFIHLQDSALSPIWLWPAVVLVPLAGAFRLARFNLLPPKPGQIDSTGLTISTAGAMLALAVLADIALPDSRFLPLAFFPILMVGVSVLMVSHIPFPPLRWVYADKRFFVVLLAAATWLAMQWSFMQAWFMLTSGYLGASIARAGYRWRK